MNSRVESVEISGIRKFFNKVSKIDGAISLTLGQPDFEVPLNIKKAMIESINSNKTSYTKNEGIYELRYEISKYLCSMNINYSPDEICITVGGSEGLFSTLSAILDLGDSILIPNPAYPAYTNIAKIIGANTVEYNLKEDFSIDIEDLCLKIKKSKPKVIILSYPCNPTGAVLSKEEKEKLYKIIKENDILVISDEIYCSLYYGEKYNSLAQYEDIRDKIILIGGFSKIFSMTGLRIGYLCASNIYLKEILKVHQYNVSCATSIAQWGAYEGLKSCMKDVDFMKEEFRKRRDYVYSRLESIDMKSILPMGAFYIFPSINKFSSNSEAFCTSLLEETKVACVPGSAFGSNGENHMRISYCYDMKVLKEALDRMELWITQNKY